MIPAQLAYCKNTVKLHADEVIPRSGSRLVFQGCVGILKWDLNERGPWEAASPHPHQSSPEQRAAESLFLKDLSCADLIKRTVLASDVQERQRREEPNPQTKLLFIIFWSGHIWCASRRNSAGITALDPGLFPGIMWTTPPWSIHAFIYSRCRQAARSAERKPGAVTCNLLSLRCC